MNDCELCHMARARHSRDALALCDECAEQWDYDASLTPEERRQEQDSIARYTQESQSWG